MNPREDTVRFVSLPEFTRLMRGFIHGNNDDMEVRGGEVQGITCDDAPTCNLKQEEK